ncbi:MAG: TonB-dependent receptor [Bacteroidota bacterium]
MRLTSTTLFFCLIASILFAQSSDKATIFGKVTDIATGETVEFVTVYIKGTSKAAETNAKGEYSIDVPTYERIQLVFTRIGYKEAIAKVKPMSNGVRRRINVSLAPSEAEIEVEVTDSRIEDAGIIREEMTELKLIPTTTGNLESVLPSIALGTNSGTGGELSSQYQVRGGNYDENLVYVNDFEIYRPQLIRAGQQEGLTFPNIDLVRDLSFSSGGFQAKYGDKLSSVLDIRYKRPDSTRASVGMSFLGGSAHLEGSFRPRKSSNQKVRYLLGARYKTTRYLLGSLDTKGEYIPNFADIQTYITYDINRDWQLGLIGNYNRSEYQFIPTERTTGLGLIDFALQLFTVFDGQEVDDFTTYMGGASLTYLPDRSNNPFYLKFLTSTFQINENERFDIIGDYLLGQVESDLGSDNFGEIVGVLGTGTQQQFVRNYLNSNVTNIEHKGGLELQAGGDEETEKSHFLQWGVKFQHEAIDDEINEWERLDSAGYSLSYDTSQVLIRTVLKTRNNLSSNRFSAYFQDTWSYRDGYKEIKLSAGVRANYWDLNNELIISPRAQLLYKPVATDKDISYKLAAGLYFQPPFYRELRRLNGTVNRDLQAQKSLHIVGGLSYDFFLGRTNAKKFRLIMEAYYKRLWDMVSYDIDNVRIRYSGDNDATGYVAGLDMRINGEFVPGAESWINLSFLRARESLNGIQHLRREIGDTEGQEVNDVPRPTDRFMNLSMFFQDYLPKNEDIKMHLNLTVGTGLPYGILGNNQVYRNTYRFKAYHRVDIGFAVQLWEHDRRTRKPHHPLRFTRNTWLSLEIFNLLQVANVASTTWIKAINNVQYSVPNFLTSRRINLRLRMDF